MKRTALIGGLLLVFASTPTMASDKECGIALCFLGSFLGGANVAKCRGPIRTAMKRILLGKAPHKCPHVNAANFMTFGARRWGGGEVCRPSGGDGGEHCREVAAGWYEGSPGPLVVAIANPDIPGEWVVRFKYGGTEETFEPPASFFTEGPAHTMIPGSQLVTEATIPDLSLQ